MKNYLKALFKTTVIMVVIMSILVGHTYLFNSYTIEYPSDINVCGHQCYKAPKEIIGSKNRFTVQLLVQQGEEFGSMYEQVESCPKVLKHIKGKNKEWKFYKGI